MRISRQYRSNVAWRLLLSAGLNALLLDYLRHLKIISFSHVSKWCSLQCSESASEQEEEEKTVIARPSIPRKSFECFQLTAGIRVQPSHENRFATR